jgi:hypothetical protein
MSTEEHNTSHSAEPLRHADVNYEHADIDAGTILKSLLFLAISVMVAFAISIFVFRATTKLAADSDTPEIPAHRNIGPTIPPAPMLQGILHNTSDPQQDLRNKIAADEAENNKLEWLPGQQGVTARIPVDEAMKIIVAKGLPAPEAAAPEKKK